DRAYAYLAKALRNQPDHAAYLGMLPQTVSTDDQVMAHFPALEKAAHQPGAKPELQALVARGYAKKKNIPMAARLFAEIHSKNPKLLEGNREAMIAVYEAKNFELAGKLAESCIAKDDRDRQAQEIRLNSYSAMKKTPQQIREALKGVIA